MSTESVIYVVDRLTQLAMQSAALQQNGAVRAIAAAFNWWGGTGVICFAALLWLGARALARARAAELGLRGVEGSAVASAISGITKGLASRARPFVTPGEPWHWEFAHGWSDAHWFSMPSGHTTAAFAFAAAVSVAAMRRPAPRRWAIAVASFASALLVAFARVYFDQHWLSDVAAGAFVGSVAGFVLARWHVFHPGSRFDHLLLGTPPAWRKA